MHYLTPEQVEQLIQASADHRLHALWVLMVTTGLRVGEAIALTWDDVDIDKHHQLTIRRALQRQRGKGLTFVEPKTARSRRTIPLIPGTCGTLKRHRTRQLKDRLAAGSAWLDNNLIFRTRLGGPLDSGNVYESFQRVLKRAGLPRIRVHDLRHTCATYLLSQGADIRTIQDILGHSTSTLTLKTYLHVMPAARREALLCMEALFPKSQSAV
jgi:integrase